MTGVRFDTVSFLSDYGHGDEFVGVVHSVIRQLAPHARVVDITHGIAPFDVRGGGLALARSVHYLTPGVWLAVVDPGVGSDRRAVALEVADGQAVLVGPDNGLLAPAAGMVDGVTRAVWLNDEEHQLARPGGATFDGRDVFAPAAAHLCNGVPLEELGEEIDPAGLMPGLFPLPQEADGGISAEVLWVDRYGNAQLNVAPDELDALGTYFELRLDGGRHSARRADHFAAITPGGLGLVVDANGFVAVAADRSSAAEELHLGAGDPVTLVPLDADERRTSSPEVPVRFGRRPDAPPGDAPRPQTAEESP